MTNYLVQADTAAQLHATLTRHDTGEAIPLTDHSVALKVRARNTTIILFTIIGQGNAQDLIDGKITFLFGTELETLEGFYDGEIEITYVDTSIESVYELIGFQIRADF